MFNINLKNMVFYILVSEKKNMYSMQSNVCWRNSTYSHSLEEIKFHLYIFLSNLSSIHFSHNDDSQLFQNISKSTCSCICQEAENYLTFFPTLSENYVFWSSFLPKYYPPTRKCSGQIIPFYKISLHFNLELTL